MTAHMALYLFKQDRRTFWRWTFNNCPRENLFAFRLAYERMTGRAVGALILAARLDIHHGYLEAPRTESKAAHLTRVCYGPYDSPDNGRPVKGQECYWARRRHGWGCEVRGPDNYRSHPTTQQEAIDLADRLNAEKK